MQASNLLEVPPQPNIRSVLPTQKKEIDTRWVEIKFSAPFLPRSYFASCIQAGTIYVHGGFSAETGILSDFYSCCLYDQPASWRSLQPKQIKAIRPPGLRNHTLNSHLSNLLLVGGQKNVVDNNGDIYRFDLLSNTWTVCNCLDSKGKKLAIALDSQTAFTYKNHLYVLNGYDALSTEYFQNILKINLQKISQDSLTYEILRCDKAKPSPRGNCSFSIAGNYLYLFGGGGNVDDVYGDFWRWKIQQNQWQELKKNETTVAWPDKRKGASLVHHEQSNTLFLFGGIKKVTKEQNDVMVYVISQQKWVRIHSSTNDLYDPSPTLKQLAESPTLAEEKRRRQKAKSITQPNQPSTLQGFKIGIQTVMQSGQSRMHETGIEFRDDSPVKHQATETATQDFRRRVSVVQQKKYRDFLNRKKKLLSQLQSSPNVKKRTHSPTSEALIFSLSCMGQQPKSQKSEMGLPKVIFDEGKGHVIGKKPCARDGHAALLHDQSMIILGGDRHMVSFNDAYLFRLDKGVESLPYYQ